MNKQIIGSIVILVGLGLATFFVYQAFFPQGDIQTTSVDPTAEQQDAARPAAESPQQPESPPAESAGAPEPVTLPPPEGAPAEAPAMEAAPAASDPVALAAKAPMAGAPVPQESEAPTAATQAAGAPAAGVQAPGPQEAGTPMAESTPLPAEPETAALSPLEPREEHGLLAGRYRGFTSAKKRLEKIKEQDLPAFVRPKGRFYEVWAGPFATTEEAEQARKSLRAVKISGKMGTLIIPVPK